MDDILFYKSFLNALWLILTRTHGRGGVCLCVHSGLGAPVCVNLGIGPFTVWIVRRRYSIGMARRGRGRDLLFEGICTYILCYFSRGAIKGLSVDNFQRILRAGVQKREIPAV